MPLSIYRLNTKIRPTMLCLSGFELYSRWVPQFPFLFLTHSLFFSDIPGSQPLFHSDFFIQHARKSTIQRPFRFLGYSFMLRLRYILHVICRHCNRPKPLILKRQGYKARPRWRTEEHMLQNFM